MRNILVSPKVETSCIKNTMQEKKVVIFKFQNNLRFYVLLYSEYTLKSVLLRFHNLVVKTKLI